MSKSKRSTWTFEPADEIRQLWVEYVRVVHRVAWNPKDRRQRGWRTNMLNDAVRGYLRSAISKADLCPDERLRIERATDEALDQCAQALALRREYDGKRTASKF